MSSMQFLIKLIENNQKLSESDIDLVSYFQGTSKNSNYLVINLNSKAKEINASKSHWWFKEI